MTDTQVDNKLLAIGDIGVNNKLQNKGRPESICGCWLQSGDALVRQIVRSRVAHTAAPGTETDSTRG